MNTALWQGDNAHHLTHAAWYLSQGFLVAFPTETVYGLGANALSDIACRRIYQAKGRPSDNPLIVHIYHQKQLQQLVREIPPVAHKLMDAFWPGPLTLVLQKSQQVPDSVTGGLDTVAVRMPSHPVALALLEQVALPIAAPSANISGKPSPTTAAHVLEDLSGKIAGVIDGGNATVGLESTVVDVSKDTLTILRPGAITKQQLEQVLAVEVIDASNQEVKAAPQAPGMKYTHYAPQAPLEILPEQQQDRVLAIAKLLQQSKGKFGWLLSSETAEQLKPYLQDEKVQILGSIQQLDHAASNLFASLRWFDQHPVERIYAEPFPTHSIGNALMNRLNKAAEKKQ